MKKIGFRILYIVTAIVIFTEVAFSVKGSLFTDISQLPTGDLAYTAVSPSGEKFMNIYVVKNNIGAAVRGEIVTKDQTHNIFWQTGIETVDAYWSDEQNVIINGMAINSSDTFGYDSRRGYSLFDEGSLGQNFTDITDENEKE